MWKEETKEGKEERREGRNKKRKLLEILIEQQRTGEICNNKNDL